MLVLSRKKEQKVSFPGLGITVQVLSVRGSAVRLGVKAPTEVRILRDEIDEGTFPGEAAPADKPVQIPREARHYLRNELHVVQLALELFKQQVDAGTVTDADAVFEQLVGQVKKISQSGYLCKNDPSLIQQKPVSALVVDDDDNEREMLAGFLRLQGFTVHTASDGLEAIEHLRTGACPTVILMDMRMPRCDGPTTIRRIRATKRLQSTPIFAISGSTREEAAMSKEASSVSRWFMKPINPTTLIQAMKTTDALQPTAA